jgi:hypothetical protein
MAISITPNPNTDGGSALQTSGDGFSVGHTTPTVKTSPEKYSTVGELVGLYAKPDVREQLIQTYGDQGITGFLKLTGAVNAAATQDEVTYFEEGRRHKVFTHAGTDTLVDGDGSSDYEKTTLAGGTQAELRLYDVIMNADTGVKYIVVAGDSGTNSTVARLDGDDVAADDFDSAADLILLGNMHPQGSDQPGAYFEPRLVRRKNPFMIVKERYQVNGSAATNIGYVNLGNGDYRWYIKGEQEARARFEDQREMMMLFADLIDGANKTELQEDITTGVPTGSEGYFSAIADRGITVSGLASTPFSSMADFDDIIKELDKEGAPAEYAMYLNRTQDLAIDDLLATGIATATTAGLTGQFGAFNNSADMAVNLGFKSFTRGGYTFHKHDWKLLNDPTLMGAITSTASGVSVQGAMVPMTQVVDPRTGSKAPALEMNYKAANGYSREMEHWVTGGGVLGFNNNGDTGKDVATFHYRSEINLITRAANQHVALKG